ncbi:tetratricopeptide repeat protein [Leptothoe sp. PORK10 BA2]|uniref:tetratricopeptide repeat protein n=1 Tax=Leptothoe sp. PORK10 BA2 TaxID=3110254 RepID=UPI002B1FD905|nr:tetratricopeptide repeat protein [Leptothoe sp. PORK10 BA2]MEA5464904.1 tetratricopeptide repeat protein [Leptothoe sp. PORK10 BA2]
MPKGIAKTSIRILLGFTLSILSTFYLPFRLTTLQPAIAQVTAEELLAQGIDRTLIFDEEGAIEAFAEAIRLQPGFAEAYYQRALFLAHEEVLTLSAARKLGLRGEGDVLRQRIQNKAIADFTYAILLNSEYLEAYYQRAFLHAAQENHYQAISDFSQVIRIDPTFADAYLKRGIHWYALDKYQEAVDDFKQVSQLVPEFSEAYYRGGFALGKLARYEEAVSNFVEVIRLDSAQKAFQGDNQHAISNWQDFLNNDPKVAYFRYRGIATFYVSKNYYSNPILRLYDSHEIANASADLEIADQLMHHMSPDISYFQARLASGENQIARFDEAIQRDSTRAESFFLRAQALDPLASSPLHINSPMKPSQNIQRVLSDYDHAIQLDSEFSEAYYYRGLLRSALGNERRARQDFISAFQLNPTIWKDLESFHDLYSRYEIKIIDNLIHQLDVNPITSNDYYQWAQLREHLHDFAGAFRDYNQAIRLDPNHIEAYYFRNLIRLKDEETQDKLLSGKAECDTATEDFSQAIERSPEFAEAYYQRGLWRSRATGYKHLDQWREEISPALRTCQQSAIDDLTQAIRLNPEIAIAYYVRGDAYSFPQLDLEEAMRDFTQMLRTNPEIFNGRGEDVSFNPENAATTHKKVDEETEILISDPQNIESLFRRAFLLIKLGEFQQAGTDFDSVLHLEPANTDALYGSGWTKYRLNELDKAISVLNKAIQLNPTYVDAYVLRALIHYDLQNLEEVLQDTITAMRLEPSRPNAFFIRSLALQNIGEFEDAQKTYHIALGTWPCIVCAGGSGISGAPETYFSRAVSLARRGDRKGAVRNFELAADLFQQNGNLA